MECGTACRIPPPKPALPLPLRDTDNAASGLPGYLLKGPAIPLIGRDATGLIGVIGYVVLALVLLFSRTAFATEKETRPERAEATPAAV